MDPYNGTNLVRQLREEWLSSKIRKATPSEYADWLYGYMTEKAGSYSNYYDHPMSSNRVYVAVKDFTLPPLYGAESIRLIVPKNRTIKLEGDEWSGPKVGHSTVFFMAGFSYVGMEVPMFPDVISELEKMKGRH